MNKIIKVLCSKEGCKFKRSVENKYCNKHQLQLFVDETIAKNKKLCSNYNRGGCRIQLEQSYTLSKCQICLGIDRAKDRARRDGMKQDNIQVKTELPTAELPTEKGCTTCCKVLPMDQFIGVRTAYTLTCKTCREDNKTQDLKRDKDHRNEIARKNDSKPERVEVKKQWKENNYEKVAEYWMNSRQHKIERVGIEEYLKDNANNAQNWRDNNPDKVMGNNENKRNSYESQYAVYGRSAELKQLEFNITFDEYEKIVKNPCHYCGIIQDRGTEQFNGIDRVNNTIGYILDNCVSCCKMCNYMKKSLSRDVFVNRVEHILTFNKHINGNLFPELFADHRPIYIDYKYRAFQKQQEFTITENEFSSIIIQECYMCGKQNSNTHKNGIDRYDNSIGYLLENCKSCCGECNYMKREYIYNDVFDKFKLIYEHNNCKSNIVESNMVESNMVESNMVESNMVESEIIINNSLVKGNKKTPEQIKEESRIKKQKQREALKNRLGDEEYKKAHAKKIAEDRARAKKNEKKN